MGAVTHPNSQVQRVIRDHFVPVQFNVVEQPEVMELFQSSWTPTLIIQDAEGREHRRYQGYLDVKRMLGELSLGRLKDAVDRQDFQAAAQLLPESIEVTKGDREREPEAMYWAAVIHYKTSPDHSGLLSGWNDLLDRFPDSEWAKRASFIRSPEFLAM